MAAVNETRASGRREWLWFALVAAVIFGESTRGRLAEPDVPGVDKYAHFLVYGLLGTLAYRALRGRRGAAWWALALASLYGVTDELHQFFVPGRSSDVKDWIADTGGAALAIFLYVNWTWYRGLLEMRLAQNRRIENNAAVVNLPGT